MATNTTAGNKQPNAEQHLITYKDPVVKGKKLYWITKRLFDIIASFFALLILSVTMIIVALIIYGDDTKGSPIFTAKSRQKR